MLWSFFISKLSESIRLYLNKMFWDSSMFSTLFLMASGLCGVVIDPPFLPSSAKYFFLYLGPIFLLKTILKLHFSIVYLKNDVQHIFQLHCIYFFFFTVFFKTQTQCYILSRPCYSLFVWYIFSIGALLQAFIYAVTCWKTPPTIASYSSWHIVGPQNLLSS